MIGWIILGVIAALIVVILCLRVGVTASFGEELRVTARIGPVTMQIIPPPEKKPKKAKPEKAAKDEKKPKEKKKPDIHLTFEDIKGALSALWRSIQGALRRAGKRIRIDPMRLSFVFADEDPVNTAQWYGWANTAMWTVMPRLEEWIHIPAYPHGDGLHRRGDEGLRHRGRQLPDRRPAGHRLCRCWAGAEIRHPLPAEAEGHQEGGGSKAGGGAGGEESRRI